MVGKPGSGRRPGFKHSEETKQKISDAHKGIPLAPPHRDSIALAKARYNLDEQCVRRFEDLRDDYPGQEDFFLENRAELLFAMRDVRTEQELRDIRLYIETNPLRPDEPYQYSSSSCYAAEDAMIALLDFKRLLQKSHQRTTSF
jgi:hypothetical protein